VFTTLTGGHLDKDAVLRAFRKVVAAAGLDPKISNLVGHKDQTTTETRVGPI
jgi:hypothetical protein